MLNFLGTAGLQASATRSTQAKQPFELAIDWPSLFHTLKHRGVVETHLDYLHFPRTPQMWAAAQALAETLPEIESLQDTQKAEDDCTAHCVHADAARFATDYAEIFRWGLSEPLLDVIEHHMGTSAACIGVAMRKDSPDGQQTGTRLWHVDGEDNQVFKLLVYLNPVNGKNGPFEYVPKDCFNPRYRRVSWKYRRFWRYFCKNEHLEKIVPPEQWRAALGPAGTTILADTTNVFHHGAIAQEGERIVLIFAYTSQNPKNIDLCKKFFPRADLLPAFARDLSPRQQNCLLGWRGLKADPPSPAKSLVLKSGSER